MHAIEETRATWSRRSRVPLLGLLGFGALIASCAQVQPAVERVQEVAADVVLPVEREVELGRRLARELEREVELHPDERLQRYVQRVGASVVRQARDAPEGLDFTFKVIDDDEQVNAVTLPGGYIYVFSGLLQAIDDEAELAGVLAHEVAHETERHVAERMATLYGVELLNQIAFGQESPQLAQLAAQIAATGALLSFSRAQEREADVVGLNYLARAGYDPRGMVRFFEELAERTPRGLSFLQTHPHPAERLEYLEALIAARPGLPEETDREEYQAMKRLI